MYIKKWRSILNFRGQLKQTIMSDHIGKEEYRYDSLVSPLKNDSYS